MATRIRLTKKYQEFFKAQGIDANDMTEVVPRMHQYKEQMAISSKEERDAHNREIEAKKQLRLQRKQAEEAHHERQDNPNPAEPFDTGNIQQMRETLSTGEAISNGQSS